MKLMPRLRLWVPVRWWPGFYSATKSRSGLNGTATRTERAFCWLGHELRWKTPWRFTPYEKYK